MSSELLVPPVEGWTTDDLDRMPMTGYRHELTDGVLSVSPSPSGLHQTVIHRMVSVLESVLPERYVAIPGVEIRFGQRTTRIPDLVVVESADPGRHWFAPAEVVVAVEVESPGKHIEDRVTKPAVYARSGIPHYWRIETDRFRVTRYELADGGASYTMSAPAERLSVEKPVALDVGRDDLLPRWAR